jgi:hypothetical protein
VTAATLPPRCKSIRFSWLFLSDRAAWGSLRSVTGGVTRAQSPTAALIEHFLDFIQSAPAVLDLVGDLVCLEFGFDLGDGHIDHEVEGLRDLRCRRHHTCRSDDGRHRN